MKFYTLTHPNWRIDFKKALFDGLAPDGGLYHPVDSKKSPFEGGERSSGDDASSSQYNEKNSPHPYPSPWATERGSEHNSTSSESGVSSLIPPLKGAQGDVNPTEIASAAPLPLCNRCINASSLLLPSAGGCESKYQSFLSLTTYLTEMLFGDEFTKEEIQRITTRAFTFEPKLVQLSPNITLLELFHGPTCAFKDFGARFMARAMDETLASQSQKATILVATSGDTGSAVASAFYNCDNIHVVILYPSGRVSPLQEQQLATWGGNISALEVEGSFDECQDLVKQAFKDSKLKQKFGLTSANSINVGRLLPQALYYVHAVNQLKTQGIHNPVICVPSGNFGNLTAAVYTWSWGLPVSHFIAANNANDTASVYLNGGEYMPKSSTQTYSNAMDVGAPNNWERLTRVFNDDPVKIRQMISGYSIDDAVTLETMRLVHSDTGLFIDPHTAVGVTSAKKYLNEIDSSAPIVVAATAHPAKFTEVVYEAVGQKPELPERLTAFLNKPKQSKRIKADFNALVNHISNIQL